MFLIITKYNFLGLRFLGSKGGFRLTYVHQKGRAKQYYDWVCDTEGAVKSPVTEEILDWVTQDRNGRNEILWRHLSIQMTEEFVPASTKNMHTSLNLFRNFHWKYTGLFCFSSTLTSFFYSKLTGNIHHSLLLIWYGHDRARVYFI